MLVKEEEEIIGVGLAVLQVRDAGWPFTEHWCEGEE